MSVSVQPMGCCHDSLALPACLRHHTLHCLKSAFFSLKTTKTEIIYNIIFKGRVCLEKMTWYLYEKFHQNPKVNGISATESRLKEPNEQTQVVSAVFPQLLEGIPPCVTLRGREENEEEAHSVCEHTAGNFSLKTSNTVELILQFSTVSHSRDSRLVLPLGKDLGAFRV